MNWIILILAGLCEVGFTFCLGRAKNSDGAQWWLWIAGFVAGTVIVGIIFFNEPATFWRIFFITMLIIAVIGLKMGE